MSDGGIGAVIFDWGGTLTPWHEVDLVEQWRVYARGLTPDGPAAQALADRILRSESAAWARAREQHTSARVDDILLDAGLTPEQLADAAARAAYEKFWEPHTYTNPQVQALWEGLHDRGIRVGVLSNTIWTRDYHRAIFERDGVLSLVDADVYSSEIAWAKPHPGAFRAAADAVGVAPERCVYVGDRLFEDVHGPHQVGMRAVWVPHSTLPANQVVQTDDEPDGVARELLDVQRLVDAWSA
ncbi:HAD family hydrolase [Leekyejoonella antrihumi]|uniref:HAD family hydrolase n=1 Tax=Leekyejoonella antrihumi TaxID=1660198 RepID=A0A563DW89_9MICO|nr:HAD family hydrolase [Leekyejoonella antrihumi]TWP34379.1 HAD family hydrolase [Leekyejoonella antrihumi]